MNASAASAALGLEQVCRERPKRPLDFLFYCCLLGWKTSGSGASMAQLYKQMPARKSRHLHNNARVGSFIQVALGLLHKLAY